MHLHRHDDVLKDNIIILYDITTCACRWGWLRNDSAARGCYQGTFSCEEINASTCVISWCAHYQTSDPAMLKGLLEEMIGGALVAIAEAATASGGRKAIPILPPESDDHQPPGC